MGVFHLQASFAFYSVFVGEGHLPRLVTWYKVVWPTFVGDSREFQGSQAFDTLIFGFDCRSHCLKQGCSSFF